MKTQHDDKTAKPDPSTAGAPASAASTATVASGASAVTTGRAGTAEPDVRGAFASIAMPDLVGVVEGRLLEAIVGGVLRPGDRIVEAELARQMGISRAPVREAARRLESQGILVSRPRHGFTVRTFTLKQLDDLYQMRIQLEVMGIRLACTQASDAQIHSLFAHLEHMVQSAETLPQAERVAMDLGFHSAICEYSGNAYLSRTFGHLQAEVQMILALTAESFNDAGRIAEYHRPIVEALRARDATRAEHALRYHLEDGYQRVRERYVSRSNPSGSAVRASGSGSASASGLAGE